MGTQSPMMQRVAEQKALDKSRQNASKYDFVKVKVWLGEAMNHYYVLSRFLICRMLTVTKIPHMKAVKIALEVKKYLVDNNHLDISQDNLEAILFNIMRSRGFGDDFVRRYKLVTKFFQLRRPLIILICGASCTGKSTLAQQLASRLNLPNVLQTDIIYDLIRLSEDSPLQQTPLWERSELPPTHLVNEFQRECRIVRKGVEGDLIKAIRDGKSIIIEGLHLDPGLYLYEFGRYGLMHLMDKIAPLVQPRDVDAATEAEAEATAAAAEKDAKAAEEAAANEVEVSAKAAAEDELRDMPTIPAPLFPRMPMRAASFNDVTFMLQKDGTLGRRIPMRSLSSSQGYVQALALACKRRSSSPQRTAPGPSAPAEASGSSPSSPASPTTNQNPVRRRSASPQHGGQADGLTSRGASAQAVGKPASRRGSRVSVPGLAIAQRATAGAVCSAGAPGARQLSLSPASEWLRQAVGEPHRGSPGESRLSRTSSFDDQAGEPYISGTAAQPGSGHSGGSNQAEGSDGEEGSNAAAAACASPQLNYSAARVTDQTDDSRDRGAFASQPSPAEAFERLSLSENDAPARAAQQGRIAAAAGLQPPSLMRQCVPTDSDDASSPRSSPPMDASMPSTSFTEAKPCELDASLRVLPNASTSAPSTAQAQGANACNAMRQHDASMPSGRTPTGNRPIMASAALMAGRRLGTSSSAASVYTRASAMTAALASSARVTSASARRGADARRSKACAEPAQQAVHAGMYLRKGSRAGSKLQEAVIEAGGSDVGGATAVTADARAAASNSAGAAAASTQSEVVPADCQPSGQPNGHLCKAVAAGSQAGGSATGGDSSTVPEAGQAVANSSAANAPNVNMGASSSSAANEAAGSSANGGGPVFVPIVLSMDAHDHALLVEQWYARHKAHAGEADAGDFQAQCDAALERLRVLQDHLCAYAQRSVPVVTFDIASFGETLDRLHDYLLQCIEMAMEQ